MLNIYYSVSMQGWLSIVISMCVCLSVCLLFVALANKAIVDIRLRPGLVLPLVGQF